MCVCVCVLRMLVWMCHSQITVTTASHFLYTSHHERATTAVHRPQKLTLSLSLCVTKELVQFHLLCGDFINIIYIKFSSRIELPLLPHFQNGHYIRFLILKIFSIAMAKGMKFIISMVVVAVWFYTIFIAIVCECISVFDISFSASRYICSLFAFQWCNYIVFGRRAHRCYRWNRFLFWRGRGNKESK